MFQEGGGVEYQDALKEKIKEVKYAIRADKAKHWRAKIEADPRPKNSWKVAKNALGCSTSTSPKSLINEMGAVEENPREWLSCSQRTSTAKSPN